MQFFKKILTCLLIWESRLIVAKYKPFIVTVTGAVGKTSTKDAIYSVIAASSRYARKSEKSMNSEIGLPLTIIGAPNAWKSVGGWIRNLRKGLGLILWRRDYPEALVLEVGADHPGDNKRVAAWLHPHIAVVSRVGETPVHVEFFASPEELCEEEAALADAVIPGGHVVLIADDPRVAAMAQRPAVKGKIVSTFGLSNEATVQGSAPAFSYAPDGAPTGLTFKLTAAGSTVPVSVPGVLGLTYMYPVLAAAAVGLARGMSLAAIAEAVEAYEPPVGRMNIIAGRNGSTIIDDTYNSSPDAVLAALKALAAIRADGASGRRLREGRIVAALADMMELGSYSAREHRAVGAAAKGVVDVLVAVGPRSQATADEAIKAGMSPAAVHAFDAAPAAADFLAGFVGAGDVVLVKGSQSLRMERVTKALMADPSRAAELLVRQEKEWLDKK